MDRITHAVMEIALRHIDPANAPLLDGPDANLASVGMRSLDTVSFICDLEKSFSIVFPSEMIDDVTFRTISTVAEAVRSLYKGTDSGDTGIS